MNRIYLSYNTMSHILSGDLKKVEYWLNMSTDEEINAIPTTNNYGLYHYALKYPLIIELLGKHKNIDIEHRDISGRTA